MNNLDLLKSHVDAYTRSDGTVVEAHDDKRVAKQNLATMRKNKSVAAKTSDVAFGTTPVAIRSTDQATIKNSIAAHTRAIKSHEGAADYATENGRSDYAHEHKKNAGFHQDHIDSLKKRLTDE